MDNNFPPGTPSLPRARLRQATIYRNLDEINLRDEGTTPQAAHQAYNRNLLQSYDNLKEHLVFTAQANDIDDLLKHLKITRDRLKKHSSVYESFTSSIAEANKVYAQLIKVKKAHNVPISDSEETSPFSPNDNGTVFSFPITNNKMEDVCSLASQMIEREIVKIESFSQQEQEDYMDNLRKNLFSEFPVSHEPVALKGGIKKTNEQDEFIGYEDIKGSPFFNSLQLACVYLNSSLRDYSQEVPDTLATDKFNLMSHIVGQDGLQEMDIVDPYHDTLIDYVFLPPLRRLEEQKISVNPEDPEEVIKAKNEFNIAVQRVEDNTNRLHKEGLAQAGKMFTSGTGYAFGGSRPNYSLEKKYAENQPDYSKEDIVKQNEKTFPLEDCSSGIVKERWFPNHDLPSTTDYVDAAKSLVQTKNVKYLTQNEVLPVGRSKLNINGLLDRVDEVLVIDYSKEKSTGPFAKKEVENNYKNIIQSIRPKDIIVFKGHMVIADYDSQGENIVFYQFTRDRGEDRFFTLEAKLGKTYEGNAIDSPESFCQMLSRQYDNKKDIVIFRYNEDPKMLIVRSGSSTDIANIVAKAPSLNNQK